jgi:hypothetical protein
MRPCSDHEAREVAVLVWLEEGLRSTEQELDEEAERGPRDLRWYQEGTHMSKEFVDRPNGARKGFLARGKVRKVLYISLAHGNAARLWESRNGKLMIPNEEGRTPLASTRARSE